MKNKSLILACVIIVMLFVPALNDAAGSELKLTDTEQTWINNHPFVTVANELDWPPFDYVENGIPAGYSIDVARLIAQKTGLKMEFVNGFTWDQLMQRFRAGEIDIMPAIYSSAERHEYTLFTQNYFSQPSVMVVHKDNHDIHDISGLAGKRVAGIRSFASTATLEKIVPNITIVPVANIIEGLKAVSLGNAAAFIDSIGTVSYNLENNYIPNLKVIEKINNDALQNPPLHFGVAKDNLILRGILNKALLAISKEEKDELYRRWLSSRSSAKIIPGRNLRLTAKQHAWLNAHPVIRLAADNAWPPFEWINDEEQYQGIAADYMRLVENKLGIRFELEKDKPWPEVMSLVKDRKLDVFSCVAKSPQREEYVNFTRPYLSFPMVIVTSDDVNYIDGIDGLKGIQVGVVDGYATHEYLKANHPEIKLHIVKKSEEGLKAVSQGKIYAFVDNIATASSIMQRSGLTNLKISGEMPIRYELGMAVRKDWPELVGILQLALDSISDEERKKIHNRWIGVRYEHGFDYSLLWKSLAAFILIIGLMYFYTRKLALEISQRKTSELRYYTLFEMSNDANMTLNKEGFIDCNQAMLDMFCYASKEELLGRHPSEISPPFQADGTESHVAVDEHIATAYQEGRNFFEWTHRRANGEDFPAEVLLTPMTLDGRKMLQASVRDITSRKQAEQALERFKTTLDETMDCVFMFEPASLKFFYVNAGAIKQLGYSFDELMNMTPVDIKPEYDEKRFRKVIAPLIEGQQASITFETLHKHKDGHTIPVDISLQYIDPPGEAPRFVAIIRDVSEQKQAAQLLIDARNEAEKANLAKSEFLSSMSHELRTPLNAVLGFSQLIEMNTKDKETCENAQEIRVAGKHLLELINEVLDLSKIEAGKINLSIKDVDLNQIASECISLIQPLANERSIRVLDNITSTSTYNIIADKTRFKQVILNLLSNAIKYNKEHGSITLDCESLSSGKFRISVSDTGQGLTKEQQLHLFKPFERVGAEKTAIEGTGIGLVICKRLIQAMNGTIGFNSELGSGSIFWVDIPMAGHEKSTK